MQQQMQQQQQQQKLIPANAQGTPMDTAFVVAQSMSASVPLLASANLNGCA